MHGRRIAIIKGLIYKAFILNLKEMIGFFVATIVLIFIGILIELSIKYGNLADLGYEGMLSNILFKSFIIYYPSFFITNVCIMPGNTILKDIKAGWMRFQYASPLNEKDVAAAEYLIVVIGSVIATALSIANMAMFYAIEGQNFSRRDISLILMIILVTVFISSYASVALKIFSQNIMLAILVSGLVVFRLMFDFSINDIISMINAVCNKCIFFAAPILIIINVISYFLSVALLKRRKVA